MTAKVAPYLNESEMNNFDAELPSGTKFDVSTSQMAKTVFPIVNNNGSVKVRLSTLESTVETQSNYNRLTLDSFGNLADNLRTTDNNLQDLLRQTQEHFTNVIATLKKEYDHKFELQSTENKRLQNNIASLKAESNQTKRRLHITVEKLKKLKADFGDPDEQFDDDSSLMSTTMLPTRPNTSLF
mmetsp:Transcript_6293/g.8780  ORF Transcript_6293/g.8780 Transcript_6293/m.8780 type:complete len:184 (-) Transcript_6293:244-795(-)|eukprot:CAMPEP_0170064812 /NCGR_PEP_ID=MMETSP0019_2-20121128/5142_1 /TAXON_ID=98059 /ORGANISM="Dinobryon sp., Strain UTEXLB2267" /LENGTH=183 /DNA_ID=CAMNT_0010271541 /DNA_START=41 /DNA_END=592 /DNA_ORIENTATION=+